MKKHIKFIAVGVAICILSGFISSCDKEEGPAGVTDVEGNFYETVKIGTQEWMAENLKTTKLNDGTDLPNVTDDTEWSALTSASYCWYDNNENTNKDIYGALYNWYAVNTGKLCPQGWHVSTDQEWINLGTYLTSNGFNYDGTTTDNKYAKALASGSGWNFDGSIGAPGNTDYPDKRNATGFNALPGGVRDANVSMFGSIGNFAIWWTASEVDPATAWDRGVDFRYSSLGSGIVNKSSGFSVRCLKN